MNEITSSTVEVGDKFVYNGRDFPVKVKEGEKWHNGELLVVTQSLVGIGMCRLAPVRDLSLELFEEKTTVINDYNKYTRYIEPEITIPPEELEL